MNRRSLYSLLHAPLLFIAAVFLCLSPVRASWLADIFGEDHVSIEGAGFLTDLKFERILGLLEPISDSEGEEEEEPPPPEINRVYVQDSLFILSGEMRAKGFRRPTFTVRLYKGEEVALETIFEMNEFSEPIPKGFIADHLEINVEEGVLYYFDSINIEVEDEVKLERKAQAYFYAAETLFTTDESRFYTDGRFSSGVGQIIGELRDKGYHQAKARQGEPQFNHENGAVGVSAVITPGKQFYTNEAVVYVEDPDGNRTEIERHTFNDLLFTPTWLNAFVHGYRVQHYEQGYPDVRVFHKIKEGRAGGRRIIDVEITIRKGGKFRIGEIRFEGTENTDRERMVEQLPIESGQLLNPQIVDQGRSGLSRLNIFERVEVRYEPGTEPGVRDVVYDTTLRKTFSTRLIVGAGTFDIIRLGLEIIHNNVWGLAHQQRIEGIQSLKASYLEYGYTIPEFYFESTDFFFQADFLRREQVNFTRQEFGGSLGVQRFWRELGINVSAEFRIESLQAEELESDALLGARDAFTTAVILRANRNFLDNPVFPSDGYRLSSTFEFAVPELGGSVEYQRVELGASYHQPLGDFGLILHTGLRHGVLTSIRDDREDIPLNQRFLLGGENDVRGYLQDEASPLNDQGDVIGAEVFTLGQVQLEQRITQLISLNAFVDTVYTSDNIADYPGDDLLFSAGGGISFRLPIGPLRFEYAHNINPRNSDPSGAFHFSLGFPF